MKKVIAEDNKTIIKFEQIIAGALPLFEKLDNVDISLLLEDFSLISGVSVERIGFLFDLHGYINENHKDGSISLSDYTPLDYFIKEENRTVREKYLEVAGPLVTEYFDKFDIELYKERKEQLIEKQKASLLKEGNILLISDNEEDYHELVSYGFQNIDYFKSIIRADKYFSKHPKQLEKYHIIIKGHQIAPRYSMDSDIKLEPTLYELKNQGKVIFTSLDRYDYPTRYVGYFRDFQSIRGWEIQEDSYAKALDRIIENALINHILEIVNLKGKTFHPIIDYINPNRLPLPRKKSELKILYLDSKNISMYKDVIASRLGLNITFKEDNNYGLERHALRNLGEYDIIIATSLYSERLLYMNTESTEQCKDTGRELTLFVTYKTDSISQFDEDMEIDNQGFGDKIELQYSFGGTYASSQQAFSKEFRVLRGTLESLNPGYWEKHTKSKETDTQSIIEAAVHIYNDQLLKCQQPSLSDLDLKSPEEYDVAYEEVNQTEQGRKRQALEPIKTFNNLMMETTRYLRYQEQGLVPDNTDGINITETTDEITIQNIFQGRILCSITFAKRYRQENLRVFKIQTMTKKGNLGAPEMVGLYTRKYENVEGIPQRANEAQMNAIVATKKKIDITIPQLSQSALTSSNSKINHPKRSLSKRKKRPSNI